MGEEMVIWVIVEHLGTLHRLQTFTANGPIKSNPACSSNELMYNQYE